MRKQSFQRKTCRLCASGDLKLVLKLTPTPIADAYIPATLLKQTQPIYPLDLLLCESCGNSQISEVVDPEILYRNYIYEATSSLGFVAHFQRYADWVIDKFKPVKGSLVIDVGSNDGTLLKAFKSHGLRVLGVDPATRIAKAATKAGIKTLPEFLSYKLARQIRKKYGPATIVTTNNLYANVDDLYEFTSSVKELMAPNGIFIFESFYLPDTMKNMVFDFIEHEHLSYFSVIPLEKFFQKSDMQLIDVTRVPTKGGSLRYTVQLMDGPYKKSPTVAKFIALEKKLGIQKRESFKSFEKRINNAKKELTKLLGRLKKQGKTIAGYGASAQSTTLIYHFDSTDKLDYLVDDYKRKHNTFSPGCHIPVLPSNEIYKKKPDHIVIIAWRYAKPIIEKNKSFLQTGGHFIVPLPKLKII